MNRKQRRALLSVRRQRNMTRRQKRQAEQEWAARELSAMVKDLPFLRTPINRLPNSLLLTVAEDELEDFDLLE